MPANIVVPEVGESIVDARVAKWLKKEGDAVAAGEPLVELETDKVDLEVAAPQAGVLARIAQADGADVKVGDVLGVIEDARRWRAKPELQPAAEEPQARGAGRRRPDAGSRRRRAGETPARDAGRTQGGASRTPSI